MDVDGVLTDGSIWIDEHGNHQKKFNVKDGLGIKLLLLSGIKVIFMSGGKGGPSELRAEQLGVTRCLVNVQNKREELLKIQKKLRIKPENTAFIGDDINDGVVRNYVGILVATKDASCGFKKISDIILSRSGGKGSVREFCELLLKEKNSSSKKITDALPIKND